MKTRITILLALIASISFGSSVFASGPDPRLLFQAIKVPATPTGVQAAQVKLGQMLFHEKRISKNHDLSCNSCHTLSTAGVDREPTSIGHKGVRGGRNSPTVMNAYAHIAQFWDGRAADVEAQAKGPVLNPVEMAMPSAEAVMSVLKSMPDYVQAFKAAFPNEKDPMTYDHFGKAVGAFERQLATPGKFDDYLLGKDDALNKEEQEGLTTFIEVGCTACHSGALLGGHMYQKLGLVKPWPNQKDQGRFEESKAEGDRMMFKVPSLRNIADTAPYFHDGQTKTLEEAVKLMGIHQLGKELTPHQVASIVTFLKTLSAQPKAEWLKIPTLPQSTASTPTANPN